MARRRRGRRGRRVQMHGETASAEPPPTRAGAEIFTCAPLEWLLCFRHLVSITYESGDRPYAVEQVCRGVRERLRLAEGDVQRSQGMVLKLHERLGVFGVREARHLLWRLRPETLAAKRWNRLVDRIVLPRSLFRSPCSDWDEGTWDRTRYREIPAERLWEVAWELCGESWSHAALKRRIDEPRKVRLQARKYLCQMYRK